MCFISNGMASAKVRLLTCVLLLIAAQAAVAAPIREDLLQWLEEYRYASEGPPAGTTIGVENLDQLKPFLAPGFFEEFQFPELAIEIEGTYQYESPAVYQEATDKGGDRASLGADNSLENYLAGQPFSHERIAAASPEDAGFMVAWNHIHRWQYYGYQTKEMTINLVRPTNAGERGSLTTGLEGGGTVDRHRRRHRRSSHDDVLPPGLSEPYRDAPGPGLSGRSR